MKIFPYEILPDGKKKPIFKDLVNKASSDPLVHKQWQAFYGSRIAGYALPTGKINGVFALDIDKKNGGNGFESLKALGITELPATAWQYTPSGGMHLFFKADNPNIMYPTTVNTETKIDSRGEGGFVFLYEPRFDIPMIEAPQWVWQILNKKPKDNTPVDITGSPVILDPELSMRTFNESIKCVREAAQGERNHTLNTHSYVIGRLVANGAVSHEYAYDELKKAALSIGLDEYEAHATIMSGLGSGESKPKVVDLGSQPFALDIPPEVMLTERPRWTPSKPTLAMLTDWTKLKKPQLFKDWSSEDIILTSAVGGVGKTTLKLFEAVCMALGESFLGFECIKPGRTLFIIGEDSEAKLYAILGKMCEQLGIMQDEHKMKAILDNIIVKYTNDLILVAQDPKTRNFIPNETALDMIKEAIDDLKPNQIVIDPIAMFWGSEAGGNDMGMALAKAAIELQKYSNASVEMIAHIGKDSHSRKDLSQFSSRGGTAIPNHSRIVRTLLRLNEEEYLEETGRELEEGSSAILCYVSKFSDGSPLLDKPFIIKRNKYVFERIDCKPKDQNDNDDLASDKMKVIQFVRQHSSHERPMNETVIVDGVYLSSNIPKVKVRAMLNVLRAEGVIEKIESEDPTIGEYYIAK